MLVLLANFATVVTVVFNHNNKNRREGDVTIQMHVKPMRGEFKRGNATIGTSSKDNDDDDDFNWTKRNYIREWVRFRTRSTDISCVGVHLCEWVTSSVLCSLHALFTCSLCLVFCLFCSQNISTWTKWNEYSSNLHTMNDEKNANNYFEIEVHLLLIVCCLEIKS